ncbi:hypothetical protein LOD99_1506 [Oopsacas minuta]|uniref:Uncharacterized protein n=1 Tax=Oopsacas minuta TaxID=111878 RepID=A0AAV7K4K6_9METZ|nr:hypothetical protein LOD99_1506 [Oopsacas minuta]
MKKNRMAIANINLQRKSKSIILKILNFPKSRRKLIYHTIKRYKDTGSTSDRQRSGRPTSATTTQKRKVIRSRIRRIGNFDAKNGARTQNIKRIGQNNCEERYGPISLQKEEGSLYFGTD